MEENNKEEKKSIAIVQHVLKICKEEKMKGKLILPIEKSNERAALYCGLSVSTCQRFDKMSVHDPPKERKTRSDKVEIDSFDRDVIRRTVFDMIEKRQEIPTARSIHARLVESLGFSWSICFLRKVLKEIGFVWRRCASNRSILMERSDVTVARLRYLRQIKSFREQGRPIVYTDETYVHTTHSAKKCWQSDETSVKIPFTRGERFIIVHAGSEQGFVNGASLVFKSGLASGDYHNDMNATNFDKWLREKLIPNLPARTVLVVDNAAYHNVQVDRCPTQATRKADIIAWMTRNNIPHSKTMLKSELIEECRRNKPEPKYVLDELLKEHGHDCLRLPPYHAELNAIELIWSQVKGKVAQKNASFTSAAVLKLIHEAIDSISPEDWSRCCSHVQEKEQEFWRSNIAIERAVERFIIEVSDEEETETASEASDCEDCFLE